MKNKTVNKKVLRAMSIGLAAMMTVQPILATPVFADDTEPVDDAGSSVEATTESSSAETTTESTSAPAPTVENVKESYAEASNATGEIKDSLDQAVSAGRDSNEFASFDQNNGGELTNLNKAVVGTEIGAVDAKTLNDNREDVSDAAIKLVEDAKRDDKKFEVDADELLELNGQVNKDINKIETAEKDLNDAINKQDEAINKIEITNDFTGTAGLINLETREIESATSIPAATESFDNATKLKDKADKKFEDSKASYEEAKSNYDKAKADLDAKQQAYNDALDAAVADDSALAQAKAELETAQEDCDNLVTEINQAQEALSKSAIGKLASAIANTETASNKNWSDLDLIMKDVIKYYYFPSIGINPDKVSIGKYEKNPNNERDNYLTVTADGKVYYLNYICEKDGTPDDKIANDIRYSKMVIYEKNPKLIGHHYEVDGTEYSSDVVDNADNQVTIEFIKTSTNSKGKFIINDGTTYHIDSEGAVTEVTAEDMRGVTSNEAGKSGSYISKVEEGETSTVLKEGVLTVKTEGSVTTTTFATGKTLDDDIESSESKSSYDDAVKAAEAARDAAVNNALEEGHTLQKDENDNDIISSDITVSADASATATVEYKTKFTTTIDLTKVTAKYDKSPIDLSIGSDKEKGAVVDSVKKLVNEIIKAYLDDNKLYDSKQGFEVSYTNLSKENINRYVKFGDNEFEFANGSSVSFTYYSKATATATGEASDTNKNVTGDMSTDDLLKEAKEEASSNASSASSTAAAANNLKIADVVKDAKVKAYSKKIGFITYSRYATFELGKDAIKTTADVVKIKEEADSSVKYDYKVSNIKYADQYDTVEEKTIYSKELNVSALTRVDDYAPLLNDNYYNYKHGNSKEGIWADLGDTDSDIYNSLMTDVTNFNMLAEKYADAKTKAEDANNKVKDAQKKVNALIDSINALKNVSGSEYEKKLARLKAQLDKAYENLEKAKGEKAAVDEAYGRALAAYEDAVARLTPAPATGDEETAPTAGGGTTTAPAPAVVTTLAGTPVFALPAGGVAAPAAGVAGARTSRGAAMDSDSAAADTEDTTAKIAPTKEVEEDALAITKDTIKTIKDNETPLSSLTEDSTQKMNWWWLLLIALLGATGEEIYRRNKKKKEEEAALKAEIDKE